MCKWSVYTKRYQTPGIINNELKQTIQVILVFFCGRFEKKPRHVNIYYNLPSFKMSDQICYSAKYYDDDHEYRYVSLTLTLSVSCTTLLWPKQAALVRTSPFPCALSFLNITQKPEKEACLPVAVEDEEERGGRTGGVLWDTAAPKPRVAFTKNACAVQSLNLQAPCWSLQFLLCLCILWKVTILKTSAYHRACRSQRQTVLLSEAVLSKRLNVSVDQAPADPGVRVQALACGKSSQNWRAEERFAQTQYFKIVTQITPRFANQTPPHSGGQRPQGAMQRVLLQSHRFLGKACSLKKHKAAHFWVSTCSIYFWVGGLTKVFFFFF